MFFKVWKHLKAFNKTFRFPFAAEAESVQHTSMRERKKKKHLNKLKYSNHNI